MLLGLTGQTPQDDSQEWELPESFTPSPEQTCDNLNIAVHMLADAIVNEGLNFRIPSDGQKAIYIEDTGNRYLIKLVKHTDLDNTDLKRYVKKHTKNPSFYRENILVIISLPPESSVASMLGAKPGSYAFPIDIHNLKERLKRTIDKAKAAPQLSEESSNASVFKVARQTQQAITENIVMLVVLDIAKRLIAAHIIELDENGQQLNWGLDTDIIFIHDPKRVSQSTHKTIEMVGLESLDKISNYEPDRVFLRNYVVNHPSLRLICLRVDEDSYVHRQLGLMPSCYLVSARRDDFKLECEYVAQYMQHKNDGT
ncbi:MAG: hypothetical protein FJY85_03665 [Deltaproteobacteria bacterium]|nr:hypothetical protein [Deltaproteobacteria bacterium]